MSLKLQTIEVTNAEHLRYQPSFVLRGLERLDVTVTPKEVVGRGRDRDGNEPI